MIKILSAKKSSGYTILEIIISLFILILVFSASIAAYREFVLKKSLDSVRKQIISDIKLAQEYAQAGKKPSTCNGLNGYIFRTYASSTADQNYYRIYANCASGDVLIKEVYLKDTARQIRFLYTDGSDGTPYLLFKVLGGGTNLNASTGQTKVYTLRQFVSLYQTTISVTAGGEIR